MLGNQTIFEILRDLVPIIEKLKKGEAVAVSIRRVDTHGDSGGGKLFDWGSTKGENYRSSRIAHAMQKAYEEATGEDQ